MKILEDFVQNGYSLDDATQSILHGEDEAEEELFMGTKLAISDPYTVEDQQKEANVWNAAKLWASND